MHVIITQLIRFVYFQVKHLEILSLFVQGNQFLQANWFLIKVIVEVIAKVITEAIAVAIAVTVVAAATTTITILNFKLIIIILIC